MTAERIPEKIDHRFAALMTMMMPGLGQLWKGEIMKGVIWAFLIASSYIAFLYGGIALHLACVVDAALSDHESDWKKNLKGWKGFSIVLTIILISAYLILRN